VAAAPNRQPFSVRSEGEAAMAKLDASTTLAEVVNAWPDLAGQLERLGLDYCCGGQRTIGDACRLVGLDPEATVEELSQQASPASPPAWTAMAPEVLVDHLELVHHRYVWEELPRLTVLLDKIVSVHGARHPELAEVEACFADLRADLEPHMLKEERVLFPMIRELVTSSELPSFHCGSIQNPISVMLREHDVVGDLLARLRQLTNDYTPPDDACASYTACYAGLAQLEADTHLHVHKENNVLFPQVLMVEQERAAAPS
jgi:regulator of cell morphogenesis and NO signaling